MKAFSIAIGILCLSAVVSCNNKVVSLKQTYQDKPYEFAVLSSKDQVWTKLVDAMTTKGLVIKTIDKNTGLIATDQTSFLNSYSFENKDGSLTNPAALVVCTKVRGPFTFATSLKPTGVAGQWMVLTKQAGDKTLIGIKLANAAGKVVIEDAGTYGENVTRETHNLVVKSTGVFERSIEAALQ